jgi:hypothetical protein
LVDLVGAKLGRGKLSRLEFPPPADYLQTLTIIVCI